MYIPYQALESMHQDVVNGALRRSERRGMPKNLEKKTNTRTPVRNAPVTLTVLVRALLGMVARP